MELISGFFQVLVHLDQHLLRVTQEYGPWVYLLLFLIVFCETGLVVAPFLPGDSLLFVAGTVSGAGAMNVHVLALVLTLAAVAGDSLNYAIGWWIGPRIFRRADSWFLKQAYLERTHRFFERFGGRTIVIARFVPIVRTYAPFVAGVGQMSYRRFAAFNVSGALLWVGVILYAGYVFGNVPVVKNNLSAVILGIILLSMSPGIVELVRHRLASRRGA
ncbi:MAG TPA: DedA family protein [Burkholderiales bacterium]|nr:DedA family protein [Burkholderiales bacterium]